MADDEDADYYDQDCADHKVPFLSLAETVKPLGPRPGRIVSINFFVVHVLFL